VQAYLATFAAHLELCRVTGLVAEDACINLDALRGRATFYVTRELDRVMRKHRA
jgi:hypothetical protein